MQTVERIPKPTRLGLINTCDLRRKATGLGAEARRHRADFFGHLRRFARGTRRNISRARARRRRPPHAPSLEEVFQALRIYLLSGPKIAQGEVSSPHASRGGMSSRDLSGIAADSTATAPTGNEGLVKSDGLYRTFTPSNAGWNLQDFAWDKQAHRVASREDIAAARRDRREREPGNAVPVTDPGSAGRTLDAPTPVRPLAPATLAKARLPAGRGQSTRKAEPLPPARRARCRPALAARGASSDVISNDPSAPWSKARRR